MQGGYMEVICDSCEKKIKLTQNKIKIRKVVNDVTEQYFICPKCKRKYTIAYYDTEINENIKRINKLREEYTRTNDKDIETKYINLKTGIQKRIRDLEKFIVEYKSINNRLKENLKSQKNLRG